MISKKVLLLTVLLIAVATGAALFAQNRRESPRASPEALEQYVGKPAYKSVDPDKPLHEQISIFETAGRTFAMPTVYIQSNLGGKREQPEGINLLYVLPDYRSRADFANREEYEAAEAERRFAHMMFEPEAVRPSFDEMIANRKRSLEKVESAGTFDGLEVEHWYHRSGDQLILYSEMYLERGNAGNIVSFIECAPLTRPSVKFPGCTHKFRDKHLLYDIYYNKANYLKDWREQRAAAIRFIDSFDISEPSTLQQEN